MRFLSGLHCVNLRDFFIENFEQLLLIGQLQLTNKL
jgi:hypothetical protein